MMSMLPEIATLITFVGACLALNFTPGADMMFAVANGATNGPRSAIAGSLASRVWVKSRSRSSWIDVSVLPSGCWTSSRLPLAS